jgi:hypothetical protein
LFDAQVISKIEGYGISTTRPANTGFRQSSAFLASLPSLSRSLVAGGDGSIIWPGFSDTTTRNEMPWETGKFQHRRRETCLLNGIVEGVEVSFPSHVNGVELMSRHSRIDHNEIVQDDSSIPSHHPRLFHSSTNPSEQRASTATIS